MKPSASTITTIDEYIDGFPVDVQSRLRELRATIRRAAPMATEKIAYRMPTFYLDGNLVHFAAFQNHIGFYPAPRGIEAFRDALSNYKGAKGSVQFPHDEPLPLALIAKIVEFRVGETLEKKEKSRK
ncbi:MAG TPA: DUF1801 domain-containing protein, partial [Gemmatimonadaceae bacterium]|nr:DUF1801 domain-containing protein [Gemmatimonadaceae bacterium]